MSEDLGFGWTVRSDGSVAVSRGASTVTVVRGARAAELVAALEGASPAQAQQLLARWTGNYRRGNERTAREHPRNRGR